MTTAQIELVKLQRQVIEAGQKVLIILEGRDAAGKDGTIKRIVQHLSPREARVVALGPPSDRDRKAWYFLRYVEHLPVDGEIVLFNRSWYNRAGVERVMKFSSAEQYEMFLKTAPIFEELLVHCGITLGEKPSRHLEGRAEEKQLLTYAPSRPRSGAILGSVGEFVPLQGRFSAQIRPQTSCVGGGEQLRATS